MDSEGLATCKPHSEHVNVMMLTFFDLVFAVDTDLLFPLLVVPGVLVLGAVVTSPPLSWVAVTSSSCAWRCTEHCFW